MTEIRRFPVRLSGVVDIFFDLPSPKRTKIDFGGGNLRLIDLKHHIDYFSKGPTSRRTDRTQTRRSFRVNSILSFRHNDKHEMQHVGQLISIKGHII